MCSNSGYLELFQYVVHHDDFFKRSDQDQTKTGEDGLDTP